MAGPAPAPINISQIPLTVTIPAHPQILLALANSESMDGDLSGAIRTGSGSIAQSLLYPTSSLVNFTIPAGFTPPLNLGDGTNAPYTVTSGALLVDNSPSRLNVAKAGLTAVLNAYIDSADFGLIDYAVGGLSSWKTWVYQMSNPGGFTFTNTIPPAGQEYVLNPCYGVNLALPAQAAQNCAQLNTFYAAQNITAQQYMLVSASSDDPSVNDVFYDPGGFAAVCVVYNGPHPAPNPFPPQFSLNTFKNGGVTESYNSAINGCPGATGPTNAGFVPYSSQVMYELRGFGYFTFSETANDGNPVVPMTSSGAVPNAASVAAAIAHFTPYLAPETNSTGTQDIKASATQSPIAGLMVRAQTVFAGNPPTTNGCVTQRYVVLVTDGLPTKDLSNKNWPPLGSTSAVGYGVTATFNPDGSLAATNDQALTDVITKLSALNSGANPIQTYIIGVGAGVDPSKNPAAAATLTAMSIAGGTGTYFPATSPQAVTDALQTIITHILAVTESTASAAVNTTGLNVNSVVYQSQFVTSDAFQDWTGNVLAYPIDAASGVIDTTLADIHWSAQTQLDAQATRAIATWDPVTGQGIPFEWTPGTPASGIASNTALGMALQTFAPDTNGQDVLQYLRGSPTQEQRNPGGKFRSRSHILGDIVDSNPAYIGPSAENLQSTSYRLFETATEHRTPILYIGGNDGMLHAFDTTTGNEQFAYMPRGSYANLINLVSPFYNAQHKFFVNGSPQAADVQFSDLTWHSVLVGTEAQGGNSVFALDITDPASMNSEATLATKVLWDIVDTDLGLGFSGPAIANTNSGWKVFIGNGYNSTNQKPFLYAIDPQHGTNTKIDLCAAVPTACDLTAANGLSGIVAVNTSGAVTANADMLYAGDLQGNLWRLDISNSDPTLWAATVMFQARDAGGNKQPITTKPVVTLNPRFPQVLGTLVMFGTGQYLGVPDISNTNVQSVYGVYDPPAGYASAINRASLLKQTLANATLGGVAVRTTSGTLASYPANKGWFMDLDLLPGERVINTPALFSGGELIFTTFEPILPAPGVCTTLGSSFLMVLNFATGESFTSPQFDANGDGHIGPGDMVTVGGVTMGVGGIGLGHVYASGVTNLNGSVGGGSGLAIVTVTSLPNGGTSYVDPPAGGPPKARKAWWEIRQ
ncbi:MAG TPA: PilC/PilY family type IV pilus protein [Steroidobacteraceae bacterium]|jgi:type IV pilus assembly protein PilY1|nr:PilC/PilY family type IV pilus protein [Steroidobacteraceae bacterium]